MKMTRHEERVLAFFRANPGTCVAELERAADIADFKDAQEYRNFCKTSHSAAHRLWENGMLSREMKVDPVSPKDVWHYTARDVPGEKVVSVQKGFKAKYEALLAEFKEYKTEKQEQVDLLILQRDRAREELAELKTKTEG